MFHKIRQVTLILFLTIAFSPVFSQIYEGKACNEGNPNLKALFSSGNISDFSAEWYGNTGKYSAWTSSQLTASGTAPEIKDVDSEDHEKSVKSNHTWTCMYSVESLRDGNPKTAWAEGAEGKGIGEIVISQINVSKKIEIWTGYGQSEELFKANGRPKEIKVYVLQANWWEDMQGSVKYSKFAILKESTHTLEDKNAYQTLPIGDVSTLLKETDADNDTFIAIEILSIYEGTESTNTCISEIREL
jgi:hypothetical protein